MKISKITILVSVIVALVMFFMVKIMINQDKKLKQVNEMYIAANDSLNITKNKLGQQVAKTSVLETTSQKYFLSLKTKDEEIKQLQELVKSETKKKRDVEVALVVKNKTIVQLSDSLQNHISGFVTVKDTAYPTYEKSVKNNWINQNIQLGKNIFRQDLKIYNSYEIVVGSEPNGLFKRKQFAQITNLSPYSETEAMKVYQKKDAPSSFWSNAKWGGVGVIIGFLIKTL